MSLTVPMVLFYYPPWERYFADILPSQSSQSSRRLFISREGISEHVSSKQENATSESVMSPGRQQIGLVGLDHVVRDLMGCFELGKGALLHGPPGTGKSSLAACLAKLVGARLVTWESFLASSTDFVPGDFSTMEAIATDFFAIPNRVPIDKHAGRRVRRRSRSGEGPVILFLDEIDTLCPVRDQYSGVSAEARLTALILSLLSTLRLQSTLHPESYAKYIVIGATNRPFAIEPALRNPGRLDVEIHVPIPSEQERADILRYFLLNANTATPTTTPTNTCNGRAAAAAVQTPVRMDDQTDRALDLVAREFLIGYVGADIVHLCTILRSGRYGVRSSTDHSVHLSLADILDACQQNVPSTRRGFSMEFLSKLSHSSLFRESDADIHVDCSGSKMKRQERIMAEIDKVVHGLREAKQALKRSVVWPLLFPESFRTLGIQPSSGVLLYGPPGCAKTTVVRTFAMAVSAAFVSMSAADIFSPYLGQAEATIRSLFARARLCAPCIVFLDEIDALAGTRSTDGASEVNARVLATLLNEMDGVDVNASQRVVVIGATNRPWAVDPALARPGRLDSLVYVGLPDDETRLSILDSFISNVAASSRNTDSAHAALPTVATPSRQEWVAWTAGFSGAECASSCREAVLHAWGRGSFYNVEIDDWKIAAQSIRPQVDQSILLKFEQFRQSAPA
nr:VCP-like ATPase [Andalucia godoyi]